MKVSLVVPTYNGEKYILDFLSSINKQTRQPEQIIFQDDGSTDNTVQIISTFIRENVKSNKVWELKKNTKNLGWRLNFESLIKQAKGDIIFLADQDDIWNPEKIEVMTDAFEENQKIKVLVSNYETKIDSGKKVSFNKIEYEERNKKPSILQVKAVKENYYIKRPGWTFALSKKIVPYYLSLQDKCPQKSHDVLLWQLALINGSLFHYRKITGTWIMHSSSAMAVENEKNFSKKEKRKIFLSYARNEMNSDEFYLHSSLFLNEKKMAKYLKKRIKSFKKRRQIWLRPNFINLFKAIPNYLNLRDFLADLKFILCSIN